MSTETEEVESEETETESSVEIETEPAAQQRRMEQKRAAAEDREAQRRSEEAAAAAENTVHLKIFRYDPEVPGKQEPRFDDFHVPFEKGMTVLDALIYARDHFDPSLTFRHSCRQAVCGSDAMFVNGTQHLCCKTQLSEMDEPVRIEPLPHQEVVKDLVVDMEHFYDQMHAVEPYFDADELPEDGLEEQRQSRENREKVKMSTRCIWCAACMSSCNIAAGPRYSLSPAAMLQEDMQAPHQIQRVESLIFSRFSRVWRCSSSSSSGNSSGWKYGSTLSIWS